MCFAASTCGARGPNQNTSRIVIVWCFQATASWDRSAMLCRVATMATIRTFSHHTDSVWASIFFP